MEKKVFIQTFMNKLDADHWLEMHMEEHKEDYVILDCSTVYVNGIWRSGIVLEKKQKELDFGA